MPYDWQRGRRKEDNEEQPERISLSAALRLMKEARELHAKGESETALKKLDRLLKAKRLKERVWAADAMVLKAHIHEDLGHKEAAMSHYRSALELQPDHAGALKGLHKELK